jgi:hypothetical protein
VQLVLCLTLIVTCAITPSIRDFLYNNKSWLLVGACITGIVFIQGLKTIYTVEKRLKLKAKQQAQILNFVLGENAFHTRLLKSVIIPELFEQDPEEFIARLHATGIGISDLKKFGVGEHIIARYELFYYMEKAREQQDLLNTALNTNGDTVSTPIVKELTSEAHNATYPLRPVSTGS